MRCRFFHLCVCLQILVLFGVFSGQVLAVDPVGCNFSMGNFNNLQKGDFNCDGRIGVDDMVVWYLNFRLATVSSASVGCDFNQQNFADLEKGDADCNGKVEIKDLLTWYMNYRGKLELPDNSFFSLFQVWSDAYNAERVDCFGSLECLDKGEGGHIWNISHNKDRAWVLSKTKQWIDYASENGFSAFSLGDDVPTLQSPGTISEDFLLFIGDDNRQRIGGIVNQPCYGSSCGDEFGLGHCRQSVDGKVFRLPVKQKVYNFPNSLCGDRDLVVDFDIVDADVGRYSLIVAWYTGGVADRVGVELDGVVVGKIVTVANTADWSIINFNLKRSGKHRLVFRGEMGDGFGLDFIAVAPRVCNKEYPGFCLFTEEGVNSSLDDEFLIPVANYVRSKGMELAIEPWSFPVELIDRNDFGKGLKIDQKKLSGWTSALLGNELINPEIVVLSYDALIFNYGLSQEDVLLVAQVLKEYKPTVKIIVDVANVGRYMCSNNVSTCDFDKLDLLKANQHHFDRVSYYGYDFFGPKDGQDGQYLDLFRDGFLDFSGVLKEHGLTDICFQINPTEGDPKYHASVKVKRTVDSLQSLRSNANYNCLNLAGMNWGHVLGQEGDAWMVGLGR